VSKCLVVCFSIRKSLSSRFSQITGYSTWYLL